MVHLASGSSRCSPLHLRREHHDKTKISARVPMCLVITCPQRLAEHLPDIAVAVPFDTVQILCLLKLCQVHAVPQDAAYAAKSAAKLAPLLRFVRHKL